MSLAECDARQAVGDQAGVNGVEAVKETGEPSLRTLGGLGVDDFARTRENIIEAVLPVVHVDLVNGTGLCGWSCSRSGSRSWLGGDGDVFLRSGHFEKNNVWVSGYHEEENERL